MFAVLDTAGAGNMTAGPAGLNCAFAIFSTTEINFRSGSSEFAKSTLHWLVSVKGLPRRADTRWGIWLQHTLRKASRSERTSDARETPSRDAAKTPGKMLHEVRPLFRHIAPWWDAKKKTKKCVAYVPRIVYTCQTRKGEWDRDGGRTKEVTVRNDREVSPSVRPTAAALAHVYKTR